jgi:O-antigen/teichoic acid export membrane protein
MVLGRRTAMGGTWLVGARLLARVIDLGTMLVLAHILTPKDFGLVAIAMSVIFIVEATLELPISGALVRLEKIDQAHYDTAFTLSLLRGALLGLVICLISWPFARFYADSRLLPLVCVLSLAPAARGLVSPKLADFSRDLKFSPDFTMEMAGKIAAFSVSVLIAITTRSYWAIAAGTLIAPVTSTITSYIQAPYKPRISLSTMSDFSGFLGWNTAAQAVGAFNWQTDRLMLAKLMTKAELGLFSTANDLATIPVMALISPIQRPLLSAFSLLRGERERLSGSYQRSATAIITMGLPVLVFESMMARPMVRLMFGTKWMGAAMPLHWLALSLIPTLLAMPVPPLVMSFGKTQLFFKRNLLEVCIKVPLVILGALKYGFMGVVVARYISESISVLYSMHVVRSLVGLSIRRQLIGAWRSFLGVAAMAVVVYLTSGVLSETGSLIELASGLVAVALVAGVTYCASLWFLWNAAGCPAGLEGMVSSFISDLRTRIGFTLS